MICSWWKQFQAEVRFLMAHDKNWSFGLNNWGRERKGQGAPGRRVSRKMMGGARG